MTRSLKAPTGTKAPTGCNCSPACFPCTHDMPQHSSTDTDILADGSSSSHLTSLCNRTSWNIPNRTTV